MQHPSYEPGEWSDFLPAWARLADFASVGLLVAAATIAVSGGFRTRIADWHVAFTSPLRLVVWAIAIGAARHVVVRRHSIVEHVSARVVALTRSDACRASVAVTLLTRPIVMLVGFLAVAMIGYAPNAQPFHEFSNELFNLPLRWDAGWYLQIATNGYQFIRDAGPEAQQNIVFFPAYPMIVRLVALVFGNTIGAYVSAAIAVSVVFSAIGLAYVYGIARRFLDDEQSTTALWLMATFPFALFFGAIYGESLFLACAAGAVYHCDRREWRHASPWALVAGLTRPNGFLLAIPLLLMTPFDVARSDRRRFAVAAAPVVGVAIYALFIWHLTGSPFAWATGHAAWGRHYRGVASLVTDRYNFIAHAGVTGYVAQQPYDFVNAAGLLFVLASVWPLARRFSIALAAFVVVNVVPGLVSGGLMSMGRFSSVLFPAFIWFASVVPARHRTGWIAAFASLQALNAALFYTWRPLF